MMGELAVETWFEIAAASPASWWKVVITVPAVSKHSSYQMKKIEKELEWRAETTYGGQGRVMIVTTLAGRLHSFFGASPGQYKPAIWSFSMEPRSLYFTVMANHGELMPGYDPRHPVVFISVGDSVIELYSKNEESGGRRLRVIDCGRVVADAEVNTAEVAEKAEILAAIYEKIKKFISLASTNICRVAKLTAISMFGPNIKRLGALAAAEGQYEEADQEAALW